MNLNIKHINFILIYVALSRVRHIVNLIIKIIFNYDRYLKDQSLNIKMRINDNDRKRELFFTFIFRDSIKERLRIMIENEVNHKLSLKVEDLKIAMNVLIVESLIE